MRVTTLKMVNLSLKNGSSDITAFAYVNFALLLSWGLGDFKAGYQYGTLGVALSAQRDNIFMRCNAQFLYAVFTHHWNHPLRSSDAYFEKCFAWAEETGDFITCGNVISVRATDQLSYGRNLADLLKSCERDLVFLQGTQQQDMFDCTLVGAVQAIRVLMGQTNNTHSYDDEHFTEAQFLQDYAKAPLHQAYFYYSKIVMPIYLKIQTTG